MFDAKYDDYNHDHTMSVNWVMVENGQPVVLPNEQLDLVPATRVGLELSSTGPDGGRISCAQGSVYVSTQRLVYIAKEPVTYRVPSKGDREFRNLSVPLTKIQNGSLVTPWFGPNGWQGAVEPVADGGIEPATVLWRAKLTFKDGGAIDFVQTLGQCQSVAINGEPLPEYSA